jgi:hypothetical protein
MLSLMPPKPPPPIRDGFVNLYEDGSTGYAVKSRDSARHQAEFLARGYTSIISGLYHPPKRRVAVVHFRRK